jgi:hypothetical protein
VFSPYKFNAVDCEGKVAEVAHEPKTSDEALFEEHFEELSHDGLVNSETEDLKRVETLRKPGEKLDDENQHAENGVEAQVFSVLEFFEDFFVLL